MPDKSSNAFTSKPTCFFIMIKHDAQKKTVGSSLRVSVDYILLTLVFSKNWIQVGQNCGARSNSQGYIPLPEPAPSHQAGPFGFNSFLCASGHKFSMIRFRGGMRKAKDNLLHS